MSVCLIYYQCMYPVMFPSVGRVELSFPSVERVELPFPSVGRVELPFPSVGRVELPFLYVGRVELPFPSVGRVELLFPSVGRVELPLTFPSVNLLSYLQGQSLLEAQQSTVKVFGRWQTEEYIAHPIVDVSCQLTNLRVSVRQSVHVETVFNPQGSKVNVGTSDLSICLFHTYSCTYNILSTYNYPQSASSNLLDHLGA